MTRLAVIGIGGVALLAAAAGYGEQRAHDAKASTAIVVVDPAKAVLAPAPIRPEWVREGHPATRAGEIGRSADGMIQVYVWQTTASRFAWNYDFDETITVVDGEVFIAQEGGPERRLGPGDAAFFPTGARTLWRVPDHVRKIATVKKPLPGPMASVLRWGHIVKGWLKPRAAFAG